MKALILRTHTTDCDNYWRSFESLGHECVQLIYDQFPHEAHAREILDKAMDLAPDLIIYVGAIEQYHGRPVPKIDVLSCLNDIAPMIHICGDSSDKAWWPHLNAYHAAGCFRVQVGIDGNRETPIAKFGERGVVLLTCIDPKWFRLHTNPWSVRPIKTGMAGGLGHGERKILVEHMTKNAGMVWHNSASGATYQEMADFLCRCKFVVNSPMNGTGDGYHVKGRVIEAGLAGAVLVEKRGSPTHDWFQVGQDFASYDTPAQAAECIEKLLAKPKLAEAMANNLRTRILADHSPKVFWDQVLRRAL